LNNLATEELFAKLIEPTLSENGIQCTRERFDSTITDYRTVVQKAIASKPDLVFLSGFSSQLMPLIKALKENNFVREGNVFCVMDFVDLLQLPNSRQDFQGVAFVAPEFETLATESRDKWIASYKARFGVTPSFVPAYGYDLGYLLVLAHKNSNLISKDSILQQLPFDGIVGRLSCDAIGDLSSSLHCMQIDADGGVRKSRFGNPIAEPDKLNSHGK
jgi:branched-chain amino acid transport system substrate-binding protein